MSVRHPRALPALAAPILLLALGCVTTTQKGRGIGWDFFSPAGPDDPWFEKVEDWQAKARRDRTTIAEASGDEQGAGLIRVDMRRFAGDEKRALARKINTWTQAKARAHYRVEPDGGDPINDHWPSFKELMERNGDDCDGLDLMAYQLLREFGYENVYRAIIRRDRNGTNHMVTLWFEDPDDPWVLDATSAIMVKMRHYSEIPPGWTPTQMFTETEQYRVTRSQPLARRE